MSRDRRLLIPLGLILIAFAALGWESIIVRNYIVSSIMDPNWESFVHFYGVEAPAKGPEEFCFDYCAPKLPFVAGRIGIASLLAAIVSLAVIWWKPKK